MNRTSNAIIIMAGILFVMLLNQNTYAETASISKVKPQLDLNERNEVPFLEKPGSGWIIGSIPMPIHLDDRPTRQTCHPLF